MTKAWTKTRKFENHELLIPDGTKLYRAVLKVEDILNRENCHEAIVLLRLRAKITYNCFPSKNKRLIGRYMRKAFRYFRKYYTESE